MDLERIAMVTKHKCYESNNDRNEEHYSCRHDLSRGHCLFSGTAADYTLGSCQPDSKIPLQ